MIEWKKHFDRIWCISYTGFPERYAEIESELGRVGILDSGIFNWQRTIPSIFNDILYDATKKRGLNDCRSKSSLSCLLGHYSCVKASLGLGDRRVLILEDDVRFLKDIDTISRRLDDVPGDSDIVLFDWFATYTGNYAQDSHEYERMKSDRVNGSYSRYNHLFGASCYMLSSRSMEAIVRLIERKFAPIDHYTSHLLDGCGLNRYFCVDQIACQKNFERSNNADLYGMAAVDMAYRIIGLDKTKFNL